MAARVKLDIPMYQGEQRGYKFTFFTDEAQTTRWNISAATLVKLYVKRTLDQATELFSVVATDGANGSTFSTGVAVFVVSAANSALLLRDGKYDVFVTLGGSPISPVHGDVILDRAVKSL
jgi:hypothetical protein